MLQLKPIQLRRLASIIADAGQIILAAMVVNPLLNQQNFKGSILMIVLGIALTVFIWGVSLKLEEVAI